MRDTVMVDWQVPADEWESFREYVEKKFDGLEGYLGREAEAAMREYADADGYGDVEDRVDRLVNAAGRTPDPFKEKNSSRLHQQSTTRVTVRVDEWVKDEFRKAANESEDTFGVAFARAIQVRRDGGRAGRLERKLDRVIDDAEGMLTFIDEDTEEGGLSKVDRNTIVICQRLAPSTDDQFTDDELNAEIHEIAGRGRRASGPTLERYRDLVIERLGYEPHPGVEANPSKDQTVWVPEHVADEIAPDGVPVEVRRPVDQLEREQRVRRIRLVLGRRAGNRSSGKVSVRAAEIQADVLEDAVTRSTTLSLMEEAALSIPGIEISRSRTNASLRVDLQQLGEGEPELFEEIIAYRDADADSLLDETTETTVADYGATQGPGADLETLSAAGEDAAADGGGPPRER
ncbi:hypothetical protein SAMN05192561_11225 [Halopenitus malekzadehii]|uniref:Uncharacterized protein n=1 Tax=Halopenitus malekzadehii TaxID=1267564 RepID=A0A1H6JEF1_9EURY|nr:hypothetical protein [Halopenitus malekzadehii]SEH60658.1 hypothetical protein SAMN05192561_11225 [Halopenitus malekzadehii]